MSSDVFISYANEDVDWASRIVGELRQRSIEVWFDRHNLLPGQNWKNEIRSAISSSRYFLPLLSRHSLSKQGYVQNEIKQSLDVFSNFPPGEIYLLPARIDDCCPEHEALLDVQWVDLFVDWDDGVNRLASVIRRKNAVVEPEMTRDEVFRASIGRFRHAIIGPIQGLASSAKELLALAEEAGVDQVELGPIRSQIDSEIDTIRLWRQNQATYFREKLELRLREEALRPAIDRIASRYRPILDQRKIDISIVWRVDGELPVRSDSAALDLCLSNLMSNAAKFSFFGRTVTIGVEEDGPFVRIWVRNIGHPVPSDARRELLEGGSSGRQELFERGARGEGLGLLIARKIAEAHRGTLECESRRLANEQADGPAPHQVTFTLVLPSEGGFSNGVESV